MDGDLAEAVPGDAVTLVLDREIDVSRGDVLAAAPPPAVADQLIARVAWMDETPLFRGRAYLFMLGCAHRDRRRSPRSPPARCGDAGRGAGARAALNEIGRVDDLAGAAGARASATRRTAISAASS